ncbi:sodium channel protein Nach-like [Chironomus tepperi]|uniref:sodium channel protein Nach-like n=1 Tax=Chironomus tepperi TaxID=113505 RepID=UPI00391F017F
MATSWMEKISEFIFWTSTSIGLTIPLFFICENLYYKFRDNSMAFTLDASYLDFNTSFPSISLCQVFNGEKNWDLSEKYFGDERDKRIDDFLTEISFFTGACYTCELCDVEVQCPKNFSEILFKFRASCERDLKDTILWGSTKEIVIKVTEIINDDTVVTIPISQRRCRFSWEWESLDSVFDLYSFSTCQTNCYNKAQINFCNCTHHLMPRNPRLGIPECDFKGLICLTENFMKISEIRKGCPDCISSCEEYEYRIIFNSNEEMGNEEGTDITISMIELPNYRYFRRTVKTTVEFIMSIGGAVGLFFGFSFLSFFIILHEVVYYFKDKLKAKKS